MQINLSKEQTRNIVNICLSKAGYADDIVAKVAIVLDGSGSMYNLYQNGTVQALVDRALAVGYKFDDDGAIDVFDFSAGNDHRQLPQATQDDHGSYMKGKHMLGGATEYAPVIKRLSDFYYKNEVKRKGLMGLFGKKTEVAAAGRDSMDDKYPVFVMFITDGETLYGSSDERSLSTILGEHEDMFIQFIGIGSSNFYFLERFTKRHNNADFVSVGELSNTSDEELMTAILSQKAKTVLQK